jgi:hypothetical protein
MCLHRDAQSMLVTREGRPVGTPVLSSKPPTPLELPSVKSHSRSLLGVAVLAC